MGGSLRSLIEGPIRPQDEELVVRDLLLGNGVVDERVVPFVLPPDILAKLKAIPINHLSAKVDERIWVNSLDKFNSRDAYLVAEEESGPAKMEA